MEPHFYVYLHVASPADTPVTAAVSSQRVSGQLSSNQVGSQAAAASPTPPSAPAAAVPAADASGSAAHTHTASASNTALDTVAAVVDNGSTASLAPEALHAAQMPVDATPAAALSSGPAAEHGVKAAVPADAAGTSQQVIREEPDTNAPAPASAPGAERQLASTAAIGEKAGAAEGSPGSQAHARKAERDTAAATGASDASGLQAAGHPASAGADGTAGPHSPDRLHQEPGVVQGPHVSHPARQQAAGDAALLHQASSPTGMHLMRGC